MPDPDIPFHRPESVGNEIEYVSEAIRQGAIGANGLFTGRCEGRLRDLVGAPRVFLTKSCTAGLEMSARLLEIREGDEVILPSFGYVTTASAFVDRGAKPVFVDVRPDTLNLDVEQVAAHMNERTRAVIPIHYGGVGVDMEPLMELTQGAGVAVVEDNAHGLGGRYRGRLLGSFGCMSAMSFHETKNLSCGEGGAFAVQDPCLLERAEIVFEKGTDRARFLRGRVDKYSWVDLGSSYAISDMLAAYLFAQLEAYDSVQGKRRQQWEHYHANLAPWAERNGVSCPHIPADCESTYHIYHLLMPDAAQRTRFIDFLAARGIQSSFHYLPLHVSRMGKMFGGRVGQCPVSENVSERLIRLPLHGHLSVEDQARVIQAVMDFGA